MTLYVLAFLSVGDTVLLVRRHNALFGNGLYSLVGGKVEAGETALQAVQREVQEEIGLTIALSDFTCVHVLHRKGTESEFMAVCFKANITGMVPYNAEPEKHDDMRFFAVNALPENMVSAHIQVIERIVHEVPYSEHGW